jgi:hypothetical protein
MGGEMTQTLYAHMNERKKLKKKETPICSWLLQGSLQKSHKGFLVNFFMLDRKIVFEEVK